MNSNVPVTRRQALAIGGSAALASTAGCTAVLDAVGNQVFEQVNILNQLSQEVSGSIKITDPGGETALETEFDVPSTESDGNSNIVAYADVWTNAGSYQIGVELTDTQVGGVSQISQQVQISNTDEEMIAISIGSGDESEPIAVRVGESFSDFGRQNQTNS